MPYKDPEAQKAYQRKWVASKRAKAVEMLGGQCVRCGSKNDLEFDHIDPDTKDPSLRYWGGTHSQSRYGFNFSRSWQWIIKELQKCQLLCDSCHKAKR